jgi:hypothetical protein
MKQGKNAVIGRAAEKDFGEIVAQRRRPAPAFAAQNCAYQIVGGCNAQSAVTPHTCHKSYSLHRLVCQRRRSGFVALRGGESMNQAAWLQRSGSSGGIGGGTRSRIPRRLPRRVPRPAADRALHRAGDGDRRGPDHCERDTVLAAVKDAARRLTRWPKRAILDGGCARRH